PLSVALERRGHGGEGMIEGARLGKVLLALGTALPSIGSGQASVDVPPVITPMPSGFDIAHPVWTGAITVVNNSTTEVLLLRTGSPPDYSGFLMLSGSSYVLSYEFGTVSPYQQGAFGPGFIAMILGPNLAIVNCWRGFIYGLGSGFQQINVTATLPGMNFPVWAPQYDGRTDEQRANAPKISIGAPGGEDGFMKFGLFGNGLRIAAAGRISDPGYPINPNGLELQVDENGVRRSVRVPVGPDGSFNIDGLVAWGPNGPSGRPLFLYHRTAGDEVNVGYFGNGTEVSRKKELKTFQYDELRNKISEAVKAEPGRFRHIRTNGVTLGVRG
ncbi:MAG: hypothetical protein K1X67_02065, partial [Fimbriimonadaceae bacterium]|nr:hypothetical protein [Fimbriimonadaceae bacterium]